MIIGIDGNEANIEKRVGVNTYAYELLKGFHKLQDSQNFTQSFVIYLREKPRPDLPKETRQWKYQILSGSGLWIIKSLTPYLWRNPDKIDVFFTPSHYTPPFISIPRVCSVMDLGYLMFTEQFKRKDYWQLKYWTAYSVKISKYILSISKATTSDIQKHYPNAKNKIKTIYLAYDSDVYTPKLPRSHINKVKSHYAITKNYILFLSTLKPNKNVEGLLRAWSLIEERYQDTILVITGKKGWLFKPIFDLVEKLQIKNRVVFTDYLPEEDKPYLIGGAKVFVLPSFWEGFGLDVLNAYACGIPAVVSDRASLPEVAGNPGIYINPEDSKDIASGIEKVLTMSEEEYNKLAQKCISQAHKFSWEKTVEQTLKIIELAAK